jgi:hypothetical protein
MAAPHRAGAGTPTNPTNSPRAERLINTFFTVHRPSISAASAPTLSDPDG